MTVTRVVRLTSTALVLALSQTGAFTDLATAQDTNAGTRSFTRQEANAKMNKNDIESPLACNANALNAAQRDRIQALVKKLRESQRGIAELDNGYAVRFTGVGSSLGDIGEYITLERRCCPFFDFVLESEREGGAVWLKLTGREGVKEFARIEFQVRETETRIKPRNSNESPLVCNDGALSAPQYDRLVALLKGFRAAKQESKELPSGYAIRLPASMIQDAADYMGLVRLCSPYFETAVEVQREGGPVWLKITGREGVKALAKSEFKI